MRKEMKEDNKKIFDRIRASENEVHHLTPEQVAAWKKALMPLYDKYGPEIGPELIEKIASDHQIILNGDDDLLLKTASSFERKTVTFGLGAKNDIRAIDIENQGLAGMSFTLLYHESKIPIKIRVPGAQNIINALAASAIALSM